uniref:Uncharacterized protein n=1 Tax=Anopheles dirus TaxID=7168 RepID=A0A182NV94_9DIPT
MCRVGNVILVAVFLVECSGLHMYPDIFDPAKFLNRPVPLRTDVGRSEPDGDFHSDGGLKDGEVGFVRSSSESGKGGYRHRENFHKKDGDKYGHERQTGFGESKRTGDELAKEQGRLMVDTHHYRPEPMYEVTEEQSDVENPDKHKKYGLSTTVTTTNATTNKDKKKPTDEKPKSAKTSRPGKPRSNQKKNHTGYESIVYHENERDSTEHGYGKKKAVGKMPGQQRQKPAKQQVAHDEGDAFGDEDALDSGEVRTGDSESSHDYNGGADSGRDSDFTDNYDALRFDSDFERSFGSDEEVGDGGRKGKKSGRQNYDYDEEVDRDEVDESADEDKYRGDDDEDEEEEEGGEKGGDDDGDDDRQYEYASEADGDAQDY